MKVYKSIILLVLFFSSDLFSQRHSEIGLMGGTSYYLGELNHSKQIINKVNLSVGLFYRKNTSNRYALRFGANYGKISASDKFNNLSFNDFRQLSFSSSLLEGYGVLEFNFLPFEIGNYRTSPFSPYVFIGAAIFLVNPEIENEGTIAISSSGGLTSFSIPFGLGFKFDLGGNWGLGVEWGMRKTYTDEIDGLSQTFNSGYQLSNSQNNDWYSILVITLNYKILTESDHCPGVIN